MIARQPSVPNLIGAAVGRWSLAVGCKALGSWLSDLGGLVISIWWMFAILLLVCHPNTTMTDGLSGTKAGNWSRELTTENRQPLSSHQLRQFLLIQILHNLADVLRVRARRDQQRIFGLNHYDIVYPNHRHKFPRCMNVIPARAQREDALSGDQVAVRRRGFRGVVLVKRGPRAEVVPAEVRAQAKDV